MSIKDLEIPKKDLNILSLFVYNTEFDLYGIISGIEILSSVFGGFQMCYKGFYNRIYNCEYIVRDDFIKGKVKFVIAKYENETYTKYMCEMAEAIKEFLGDSFSDDCIIYIAEEERRKQLKAQEYREVKKIGETIPWAEKAFCDFVVENYSALDIYCLFVDGAITENQFMLELINILANELREKRNESFKVNTEKLIKELEKKQENENN